MSVAVAAAVVWWLRTIVIVGHVGKRVGRVVPSPFAASRFSKRKKKKIAGTPSHLAPSDLLSRNVVWWCVGGGGGRDLC